MDYKRSISLLAAAGVIALAPLARAEGHGYLQHNLVSDNPAAAAADNTDPNLLNPWGVAFFPGGPFWVSDNGAGVSTLYDGTGTKIPLTVILLGLGDVGLDGRYVLPNGRDGPIQSLLPSGHYEDVGALIGQAFCDSQSDTAGSSGNDCDFCLEHVFAMLITIQICSINLRRPY